MFNTDTFPVNLNNTILVDTVKHLDSGDFNSLDPPIAIATNTKSVLCTFDIINLIGWKFHEKQAKPKDRGSAKFSLRDAVTEMNKKEEGEVRYGVIIDDGDNITEK